MRPVLSSEELKSIHNPFILRPRAVATESLRDWFIRVAHTNRFYSARGLLARLSQDQLGYRLLLSQLDYEENKNVLKFLAELTLLNADELIDLPLYRYRDIFDVAIKKGGKEGSWQHFIDLSLYFCPFCLRENLYVRKIWHLGFVAICPTHRTWLVSHCTNCGKKWNERDMFSALCSGCGTSFTHKSEELFIYDEHVVDCQRILLGLMDGKNETTSEQLPETSIRNLFLLLYGLTCVIETMAPAWNYHYHSEGIDVNQIKFIAGNNRVGSLLNFTTALKAISSWPNNFTEFISNVRHKHGSNVQRGLTHEFETFYTTWLMERWHRDEFSFLHDVFEEYVRQDIIPYGQLKKSRLAQEFDEFEQNSDFISLSKAVESTGISFMELMKHIQTGRVKVYRARFEPMEYVRKSELNQLLD